MVLIEPTPELLQAAKNNPKKEVYYLAQTGEIFETYECALVAQPSTYFVLSFLTVVLPEPMLHACLSIASSSSNARSQARAAWTTSKPWRASGMKLVRCI